MRWGDNTKDFARDALKRPPLPPSGYTRIPIGYGVYETLATANRCQTRKGDDHRGGEDQDDRPQDELADECEHGLDYRTEKRLNHVATGENGLTI